MFQDDLLDRVMAEVQKEELERQRRRHMLLGGTSPSASQSLPSIQTGESYMEPEVEDYKKKIAKLQADRARLNEALLRDAAKSPVELGKDLKAQMMGDIGPDGKPVQRGLLGKIGRGLKGFDFWLRGGADDINAAAFRLSDQYKNRANTSMQNEGKLIQEEADYMEKLRKNSMTALGQDNKLQTLADMKELDVTARLMGLNMQMAQKDPLIMAQIQEMNSRVKKNLAEAGLPARTPAQMEQYLLLNPDKREEYMKIAFGNSLSKSMGKEIPEALMRPTMVPVTSTGSSTGSKMVNGDLIDDTTTRSTTSLQPKGPPRVDPMQLLQQMQQGKFNMMPESSGFGGPLASQGARPQSMSLPLQQTQQSVNGVGGSNGSSNGPSLPRATPPAKLTPEQKKQDMIDISNGKSFTIADGPMKVKKRALGPKTTEQLRYEGLSSDLVESVGNATTDGTLAALTGVRNNIVSGIAKTVQMASEAFRAGHSNTKPEDISNNIDIYFNYKSLPPKAQTFLDTFKRSVGTLQFLYTKEMTGLQVLGEEARRVQALFPSMLNDPRQIVLMTAAIGMRAKMDKFLMNKGYSEDDIRRMQPMISGALDKKLLQIGDRIQNAAAAPVGGNWGPSKKWLNQLDVDPEEILGEYWEKQGSPAWNINIRNLRSGKGSSNGSVTSPMGTRKRSLYDVVQGR